MKLRKIGKLETGQDVAIYGEYLFDFVAHGVCLGECSVYKTADIKLYGGDECEPISKFTLDKTDVIIPHCNSACLQGGGYATVNKKCFYNDSNVCCTRDRHRCRILQSSAKL